MIIIINSPEGDNKREESQESKGSKEKQDSQEKKAILIVGKKKRNVRVVYKTAATQ